MSPKYRVVIDIQSNVVYDEEIESDIDETYQDDGGEG